MNASDMWLIAGLGNPGSAYEKTRHNIGFMVLDAISKRCSIPLVKDKFDANFGRGRIDGVNVILAKPMAFMNRSGPPIQQLSKYFDIPHENILVAHDDIDLPFAKLRIRDAGGHGGHNGIRSITGSLGGGGFKRLRIGVGRPDERMDVTGHVLGKFSGNDKKELGDLLILADDAVSTIISSGVKEAMNRFN